MRQNAITGAPMRSEPKLGKACACRPSRKAATDSTSAPDTTPWPPRPCMRTCSMRPPQEPLAGAARLRAERQRPVLGLFMWGHMFFVSSILLGKDAMWTVTKFFEGYFFFGKAYPIIVSFVVATVFALFIVHAALALRKFPINYRQYRAYRDHMAMMHHEDTTLWWWQVVTGFAMFFLASVHLYQMLMHPGRSARTSPPTACGAAGGRCTSCCCSRSNCTAASACTGWRQVGLVRRQGSQRHAQEAQERSSGRCRCSSSCSGWRRSPPT
jgi:succinate dehydrogenase/fumarate reductase cytochrome b subunit